MTDTTIAATAKKRAQIADHDLISAPGVLVDDIQLARGIRYTDKASGKYFDWPINIPQKAIDKGLTAEDFTGTELMMFAIFGAKTKATNETSRVRQKNGKVGNAEQELEALDEVFGSIKNNVWKEEAEGGGGSRTDKELLATIVVELLGESKGDKAAWLARFNAEPDHDDPKKCTRGLPYMRQVLKTEAGEEYKKRSGKVGPSLASLV